MSGGIYISEEVNLVGMMALLLDKVFERDTEGLEVKWGFSWLLDLSGNK